MCIVLYIHTNPHRQAVEWWRTSSLWGRVHDVLSTCIFIPLAMSFNQTIIHTISSWKSFWVLFNSHGNRVHWMVSKVWRHGYYERHLSLYILLLPVKVTYSRTNLKKMYDCFRDTKWHLLQPSITRPPDRREIKHTDRQRGRQLDRKTSWKRDIHTDRQTKRATDIQRQRGRQTDTKTER